VSQAIKDSSMSNLLTETQSADIAGVSLDTIKKYCEIGLLNPIKNNEGSYFKEDEIRSLFYTKKAFLNPILQTQQSTTPSPTPTTNNFQTKEDLQPISLKEILEETPEIKTEVTSTPIVESISSTPPVSSIVASSQEQISPSTANQDAAIHTATIDVENINLKQQVEILKEERDWLRRRVEQLELRSEREQMLLLSESETVRRLVNKNEKKIWSLPFFNWFSEVDQHKK
jgi:hypothetical protein